jgi:cytochrome P450
VNLVPAQTVGDIETARALFRDYQRFLGVDLDFQGYRLPAGSRLMYSPFLTHRHPEFWDNPEGFMPERFAPEIESKRPRYAYYPFGAGSRICLGQHFALLEGVLILADVAQRYRLQAVPGLHVQPEFMGTLRPCTNVLMTLHERS